MLNMSSRVLSAWLTILLGVTVCVAVAALPAQAYVEAPYLLCFNTVQGDLTALETSLSPADGASVTAGAPVTFSGVSYGALTFAVAFSEAALSSPDIDSGVGTAQPGSSSSESSPFYTYTFTSTKAAAVPGMVYWRASFSSAEIPACVGQPLFVYTTKARLLMVLSPPAPSAQTTQAPTASMPSSEANPTVSTRPVPCVVPRLRGDTLNFAQHALVQAGCRLGRVSVPKHHHGGGRLVVIRQRVSAGNRLPSSTPVDITLGLARHRY
jgi:hypothetical protein